MMKNIKKKRMKIIMVKRKGRYVRTVEGIYNLDNYKDIFDLKVEGKEFIMFRVDNPKITFEVLDESEDLFKLIRLNRDIIEVREMGEPVRYARVKEYTPDDELITYEGVINVRAITAILMHYEVTDTYVRYKIV